MPGLKIGLGTGYMHRVRLGLRVTFRLIIRVGSGVIILCKQACEGFIQASLYSPRLQLGVGLDFGLRLGLDLRYGG